MKISLLKGRIIYASLELLGGAVVALGERIYKDIELGIHYEEMFTVRARDLGYLHLNKVD